MHATHARHADGVADSVQILARIKMKKINFFAVWLIFISLQNIAYAEGCRNLKPVHNLEDLLLQLQHNLDSDCIFRMSTRELSDAWKITVLERRTSIGNSSERAKYRAENEKLYIGGTSGWYVYKNNYGIDTLKISATYNYRVLYQNKSLFPEARFPKSFLPFYYIPDDIVDTYHAKHSHFLGHEYLSTGSSKNIDNNHIHQPFEHYLWFKSIDTLTTLPILDISTDSNSGILDITYYRTAPDFLVMQINK